MKLIPIPSLFILAAMVGHCCAQSTVSFNRDVRPILSDRCYPCHGPDAHARQADLRLDHNPSQSGSREKHSAIVPGKPELSELVHRIQSADPETKMPPSKLNKPLTDEQKQILVRWIAEGAHYEQHWSFQPPLAQGLPGVEATAWPQNAIDHFVLARLEAAQLGPSPEASLETLIRRVTLDLTGLPPTPEQVDEFVADQRSDAYERLVDRLMSSTAYAERRAQDWLDLARYADTRGFASDQQRAIWPWRDWVVRAMDRNMPFDQFTVEQLAGDMLSNPTDEQRLATAFHRNAPQARGMTYPVEEYRLKGVSDRVNTVGRVWLGLTLDCAECHDHKFDPITQSDYFSLFAIFNNIEHAGKGFGQGGPTMPYRPLSAPSEATMVAERRRLESALAAARKSAPKPRPLGEHQTIGRWAKPTVLANAQEFSLRGDLTITAKICTTQPVVDILSKYDWRGKQRSFVFGIGGESDENSTPGHLFFWASSRKEPFVGVTVNGSVKVNDGQKHHVAVAFSAGKSARLFVDGIEDKDARISGSAPKELAHSNRPLAIGAGYNNSPKADAYLFSDGLSDVRLSDQDLSDAISIGSAGDQVASLLAKLSRLKDPPANLIAAVPVMRERPQPRKTFIHIRGSFLDRGPQVSPAAPSLFKLPANKQPSNRLEFARWLVGNDNPLVARVVVNRFWQSYFGHGLVRTPDDFGAQGTPPSHPHLLDWLAVEFIKSGWDMKHIHRLIVTSATYRQSAKVAFRSHQVDPQNVLLSHMPRVRLPAEQIRDQALAAGGLLQRKVGGPPVFPTQPDGYWQRRVLPDNWKNSHGEDRHRRSIYTYWRRMALHPTLEILNAPARENCVVRRDVSNIPTQALVLLNDPIFYEAATALATRVCRETEEDGQRLSHAFRLVLGRSPDREEVRRFRAFLDSQREDLRSDKANRLGLLEKNGEEERALELAAWTLACSVLLNLDETITRP